MSSRARHGPKQKTLIAAIRKETIMGASRTEQFLSVYGYSLHRWVIAQATTGKGMWATTSDNDRKHPLYIMLKKESLYFRWYFHPGTVVPKLPPFSRKMLYIRRFEQQTCTRNIYLLQRKSLFLFIQIDNPHYTRLPCRRFFVFAIFSFCLPFHTDAHFFQCIH